MRASNTFANDLDKVLNVTKDQIIIALSSEPRHIKSFAEALPKFSTIADRWKDRNLRKSLEDCEAIRVLKEALKPDIMALIYDQRINFICQGTRFLKPNKKNQYIYMKLSSNKKTLCYGDWNSENEVPEIEDLTGKIFISDLKDFRTGSRLDAKTGRLSTAQAGGQLIITTDTTTPIEVITNDANSLHYWSDAINYLMGKDMELEKSPKFSEDIDLLLGHEVRLRLLDLEDVELPNKAPPIPPLPNLPVPAGIF